MRQNKAIRMVKFNFSEAEKEHTLALYSKLKELTGMHCL